MIFALLLLLNVAVSQSTTDEEVFCQSDMMQYAVGDTRTSGCTDCTCMSDETWNCTETPCCLYVDQYGGTQRAEVGKKFHDGCNKCRCRSGEAEGAAFGACTKRLCATKCLYKNWDGVMGYSNIGEMVYALTSDSEGNTCPKICWCEENAHGEAQVNCASPDGIEEPCIFFK